MRIREEFLEEFSSLLSKHHHRLRHDSFTNFRLSPIQTLRFERILKHNRDQLQETPNASENENQADRVGDGGL